MQAHRIDLCLACLEQLPARDKQVPESGIESVRIAMLVTEIRLKSKTCLLVQHIRIFFETIERIDPNFNEDHLKIEDNLEEFGLMTDEDVAYWTREAAAIQGSEYAVFTPTSTALAWAISRSFLLRS